MRFGSSGDAERFASLLDAGLRDAGRHDAGRHDAALADAGASGQNIQAVPSELAGLVALTEALAAVPQPRLSDDSAQRMRQRLLAVAAVQAGQPATAPGARAGAGDRARAWRRRVAAVAAGSVSVATAVSGVGFAASSALPGDPFYGIKRAAEAVQLDLAGSDAAKGRREIQFAASRLDELQALGATDSHDAALLHSMQVDTAAAAHDLGNAARQQHSRQPLAEFDAFASAQLFRLLHVVPTPATDGALHAAASQLITLDHEAQALAATLPALPGQPAPAPSTSPSPAPSPSRHHRGHSNRHHGHGGKGHGGSGHAGQGHHPHPSPSHSPTSPTSPVGSPVPTHLPSLPVPTPPVSPLPVPSLSLPSKLPSKLPAPSGIGPSTVSSLLGGL
jgi:hypothetical protein